MGAGKTWWRGSKFFTLLQEERDTAVTLSTGISLNRDTHFSRYLSITRSRSQSGASPAPTDRACPSWGGCRSCRGERAAHHRPAATIPGPTGPLLSAEELHPCAMVRRKSPSHRAQSGPSSYPYLREGAGPAGHPPSAPWRDQESQEAGGPGQGHGTAHRAQQQRLVPFGAVRVERDGAVRASSGVRGGKR